MLVVMVLICGFSVEVFLVLVLCVCGVYCCFVLWWYLDYGGLMWLWLDS